MTGATAVTDVPELDMKGSHPEDNCLACTCIEWSVVDNALGYYSGSYIISNPNMNFVAFHKLTIPSSLIDNTETYGLIESVD